MTGVDNRLSERLRRFLRHVVTDRESPVLVLAREMVTVKSAIPGRGKGIVFTINGDRGNRDGGSFLQPAATTVARRAILRARGNPWLVPWSALARSRRGAALLPTRSR
jgi:hypothetical protein